MTILPLYDRPQYAGQVTDWLWHAFGGEGLSRAFFASIIDHSQRPGALPLTFIAVEGDKLSGTVGLWRCDLISRQDLWPWMAALYVAPEARGRGLAGQLQQHVMSCAAQLDIRNCTSIRHVGIFTNASAGSTSVMPSITRTPPSIFIATI